MYKRFLPLLIVLVSLLISALPTYAASNAARIRVIDNTPEIPVYICNQVAPNNCNGMTFTAGHLISFELVESTGTPGNIFDLIVARDATKWNNRGWAYSWTGVGAAPTCTYTETSTRWSFYCSSATNNIVSVMLYGNPTSAADDSSERGITRVTGFPASNVNFGYSTS